jgi:hypothetical protein
MVLPESSPGGMKLWAKHDDACCTADRLTAVQLALNIPTWYYLSPAPWVWSCEPNMTMPAGGRLTAVHSAVHDPVSVNPANPVKDKQKGDILTPSYLVYYLFFIFITTSFGHRLGQMSRSQLRRISYIVSFAPNLVEYINLLPSRMLSESKYTDDHPFIQCCGSGSVGFVCFWASRIGIRIR